MGITTLAVLIIISLLVCCIIPILRDVLTKAFVQQINFMATTRIVEDQLG